MKSNELTGRTRNESTVQSPCDWISSVGIPFDYVVRPLNNEQFHKFTFVWIRSRDRMQVNIHRSAKCIANDDPISIEFLYSNSKEEDFTKLSFRFSLYTLQSTTQQFTSIQWIASYYSSNSDSTYGSDEYFAFVLDVMRYAQVQYPVSIQYDVHLLPSVRLCVWELAPMEDALFFCKRKESRNKKMNIKQRIHVICANEKKRREAMRYHFIVLYCILVPPFFVSILCSSLSFRLFGTSFERHCCCCWAVLCSRKRITIVSGVNHLWLNTQLCAYDSDDDVLRPKWWLKSDAL